MTSREIHWSISGEDLTVRIDESKGSGTFHVSGRSLPFRLVEPNFVEIDGALHRFYVVRTRNDYAVWLDGRTYHLQRIGKGGLAHAAAPAATGDITALMPGKILSIEVKVGDTVEEKQTLAVMESMKMESALRAPRAGRVAKIHCQAGQVVNMGELLIVIE